MTAISSVTPQAMPGSLNPLTAWLLEEGWQIGDGAELTRRLAKQLSELGIPVSRIRLTLRTLHPQFIGVSYTWSRGTDEVDVFRPPYSILTSDTFLKSPYAAIFEGAGGIRRRLDVPDANLDFPILEELRAEGATDYVAMPILFSDGKIHAITFASDHPGGFSTAQLGQLYGMLPALGRVMEVLALRDTARTILDTYLGRHSGERVLKGLVKRGDGENIHAVIWFCDLRNSTPLADSMPRAEFLGILNEFFECMAGAVLDHGGEVLRFIGDAVLAIYPMEQHAVEDPSKCPIHQAACRTALSAARDAIGRMRELNARRRESGQDVLGFGIGLHLGDVMYGNIGVPQRLEFSVIGAAANEAARLESMTKTLGRPLVISSEFARVIPENWVSLGHHSLRGVSAPQEIFTVPDAAEAA